MYTGADNNGSKTYEYELRVQRVIPALEQVIIDGLDTVFVDIPNTSIFACRFTRPWLQL